MLAQLEESGARISRSQLERWRREGLLPHPRQIGLGRGSGGSYTTVPPDSAAQAIEIDGLYALRRKREWVGWQLWMRGYPVSDEYWRPAIERARATIIEITSEARRYRRRSQIRPINSDDLDRFVRSLAQEAGFLGSIALLDPPAVETVVGIAIDIVAGSFAGFGWDSGEAAQDREAVLTLVGARNADRHSVAGNKLEFASGIDRVLKEITRALRRIRRSNSIFEPSIEVRHELPQILEIGINLNEMLMPVLGRSAFGLGIFKRIAELPTINIHAGILLIWTELRNARAQFLSSDEISELHICSIDAAEVARQFWGALEDASPESQTEARLNLKSNFVARKGTNKLPEIAD